MANPPIYEQLMQEFPRYDHPEISPEPPPPEDPVSLASTLETDLQDLVAKGKELVARGEAAIADRLPEIASVTDAAETNPVVQAVLAATHVPASVLSGFAKMILDLEDELAAHEAATAPPIAPEAPAVPAEPVDAPEPVEETTGTPNLNAGAEQPAPAS